MVCSYFQNKIEDDTYCLPCHSTKVVLPKTVTNSVKTILEMRKELKVWCKSGWVKKLVNVTFYDFLMSDLEIFKVIIG